MRLHTSCAVLVGWMLAAASAPAAANTFVRITTPLYGLAVDEELVLRVFDVKGIASSPAHVRAVFVDEDGDVVETAVSPLPPGPAFTFHLPQAALGNTQPFPAVRMLISLELPGTGEHNQVLLNYEFFNVATGQARPGGTCAQPREGGREFMTCDGPTVDVD